MTASGANILHMNCYFFLVWKSVDVSYIYTSEGSWLTVIEGDPKPPFSIATTPKCWGRHYSFPLIVTFTDDSNLIVPRVK